MLIGAVLVFFMYPKKDEEAKKLAAIHAADMAALAAAAPAAAVPAAARSCRSEMMQLNPGKAENAAWII